MSCTTASWQVPGSLCCELCGLLNKAVMRLLSLVTLAKGNGNDLSSRERGCVAACNIALCLLSCLSSRQLAVVTTALRVACGREGHCSDHCRQGLLICSLYG